MRWRVIELVVLAVVLTARPASAQSSSGELALSTALQRAFDRSVVEQGFDPQSADIGGLRGQIRGLVNELARREDALQRDKLKIKSLRSEMEVAKDELDRLQTQIAQEMAICRGEEETLLREAQIHNDKPHLFKLPEQAAALAAYDAEIPVHKAKVAALLEREEAIKNGDIAHRVNDLIKKCNRTARGIDELEEKYTADENDLNKAYSSDLQKIAELLNNLQYHRGLSLPHHPGGEAFRQLLEANNHSSGALGGPAERMPKESGMPFDNRGPGAVGAAIPGGAIAGAVAGNANYQWKISEQKSLEAQIAAIKANVMFNPKATPREMGEALKQMSDLDSRRIGLGFQMGAMAAPTSLPLTRPRLKPIDVPSPVAN